LIDGNTGATGALVIPVLRTHLRCVPHNQEQESGDDN